MRLNKMFLTIGAILGLILISIPAVAQPSLVASYPFNGNANDESGNGHDGTNDGAVLSTDRFGNTNASYYFDGTYLDGTGTTISVASSPAFGPGSGIIIDLWIRPTAYPDLVGTGWEYHKGILWTSTEEAGFALWMSADSTIAFGVGPVPWENVNSLTRVPLGTWTNLRATYCISTGLIRLFVNGVLEDETVATGRPLSENGLVIGRNPFATILSQPCAFQGEIDDIKIWSWGDGEELILDETTVALYHMNESSGSLVADASSFSNHGTAQNSQIVDGYVDLGRSTASNTTTYGILVPGSQSLNTLGTGSNRAMTLEAFVYLEEYEYCGLEIIQKNDQYALTLGSYSSTGYLQLQLWPDGTAPGRVIQSPNQIPLNQWVHLAATWDGAVAKLFINDSLVHFEAVDVTLLATNSDLRIGDYYLVDTPPTGKMIRIDEVRISNVARYALGSDIVRIGKSQNCQTALDASYSIPIYLDNADTVKAFDIPLDYNWGLDPDSISFTGTRLAGKNGTFTKLLSTGGDSIRIGYISLTGNPNDNLEPVDALTQKIPIARIFMPMCLRQYFSAPDTATIPLPINPISVELTDKFGTRYVPSILFDSSWVRSYVLGDANSDNLCTISDPVFVINYIFAGGPAPVCLFAADADCNGIITISDPVWVINYIFAGGPVPGANCLCGAPPMIAKSTIGRANVATTSSAADNRHIIDVYLDASAAVRALQLNFTVTGEVSDVHVTPDVNQLQLFSSEVESGYRLGMIDLTGTAAIAAGSAKLLTVTYDGTGELEIASAVVVDNDAAEMNVSIGNSKIESSLPEQYSLSQNHPNPFNPTTDISFSLPKADRVKLVVYNILGEEIAVLVDEAKSAGIHQVTWDGKDKSGRAVASGVYLYKIVASDFSQSRKMLLLK